MTNPDALAGVVARVHRQAYQLDKQSLDYPRLGYEEDAADLRTLLVALAARDAEIARLRGLLAVWNQMMPHHGSAVAQAAARTPQPETPE